MNGPAGEGLKRYNHLISETAALYHEAAVKLGLSDSAMHIFYTLCVLGDRCPLSEITRLSGISRQTINSSVHRLVQEGEIFLENQNGKNKLVCLTDKGRELIKTSVLPIVNIENSVFEEWTQKEQKEFFSFMLKFRNSLKSKLTEYFDDEDKDFGDNK